MSYNYNHVTLVGRLTKDPEWVKISDDLGKATFFLAVSRAYKKEEKTPETDFLPITIWGKMGTHAKKLLKKGTPVLVWGRVQIRSYQGENGRQWSVDIVAENFQILQAKGPDPIMEDTKSSLQF